MPSNSFLVGNRLFSNVYGFLEMVVGFLKIVVFHFVFFVANIFSGIATKKSRNYTKSSKQDRKYQITG
jgi:hypothetical protein